MITSVLPCYFLRRINVVTLHVAGEAELAIVVTPPKKTFTAVAGVVHRMAGCAFHMVIPGEVITNGAQGRRNTRWGNIVRPGHHSGYRSNLGIKSSNIVIVETDRVWFPRYLSLPTVYGPPIKAPTVPVLKDPAGCQAALP